MEKCFKYLVMTTKQNYIHKKVKLGEMFSILKFK